jgi:hypothetical protein
LFCGINLWLAAAAVALAILGWLKLLNPCLILISVFFLESGLLLTHRPGRRLCPRSFQTRNFLQQQP